MSALEIASLSAAVAVLILLLVRPDWGFLGLILMTPFLNVSVPRFGAGLNAETFLYTSALVSVALRYRPALPPLQVTAPILSYVACVALGFGILLTWYDPIRHVGISVIEHAKTLKSVLWPALGFFIGFALAPDRSMRNRAMACWVIAVGVAALNSFAPTEELWTARTVRAVERTAGVLYRNPNKLGAFLALFSLVPLMGLVKRDSSARWRLLCGAAYLIAVVALVRTGSRGGWLAYLAGHSIWLFYTNRRLFVPGVTAGAILLLAAYTYSLLPTMVARRIEEGLTPGEFAFSTTTIGRSVGGAVSIRIADHQMAFDMFMDSPLWGHGFHSFQIQATKYGAKYGVLRRKLTGISPESQYLRIAVENGLLGLAILAWVAWTLIYLGSALASRDHEERELGAMYMGILAASVVANATQEAMHVHEVAISFWILSGMVCRAALGPERAAAPAREPATADPVTPRPGFAPPRGVVEPPG